MTTFGSVPCSSFLNFIGEIAIIVCGAKCVFLWFLCNISFSSYSPCLQGGHLLTLYFGYVGLLIKYEQRYFKFLHYFSLTILIFFDSLKLISWCWWFGILVNVGSCGRLENLGLFLEMCIRWLPILIWLIAFLTEKLGICLLKEKGQEILAFFCSYLIVSSHKSILS